MRAGISIRSIIPLGAWQECSMNPHTSAHASKRDCGRRLLFAAYNNYSEGARLTIIGVLPKFTEKVKKRNHSLKHT